MDRHLKICLASLHNGCAGPWVHFRSVNMSLPGLEPKFAYRHMASLVPAEVPVSDVPIRRILCKAVCLELELQPSLRVGVMLVVSWQRQQQDCTALQTKAVRTHMLSAVQRSLILLGCRRCHAPYAAADPHEGQPADSTRADTGAVAAVLGICCTPFPGAAYNHDERTSTHLHVHRGGKLPACCSASDSPGAWHAAQLLPPMRTGARRASVCRPTADGSDSTCGGVIWASDLKQPSCHNLTAAAVLILHARSTAITTSY